MPANDDDDTDDVIDDDAIDVLVPRPFATTLLRRDDDEDELKAFSWERLRRRPVIVRANGFTVRGLLHGVDEESIHLRGELRWWVLPIATVTSVVRDPEARGDDDDDDDERR